MSDSAIKKERCNLCQRFAELKNSHILPKFYYRELRKQNPENFNLRSSSKPRLRVQDGRKLKLLCHQCEQQFSGWERSFQKCFIQSLAKDKDGKFVKYTDWMLMYCTSITWRILKMLLRDGNFNDIEESEKHTFINAENTWRQFLNGDRLNPGQYTHHLFILGALDFCVFQSKLTTDSVTNCPPVPFQTDQSFRCKLSSDSAGKLSTFQGAAGMGCRIGVDGNAALGNLV